MLTLVAEAPLFVTRQSSYGDDDYTLEIGTIIRPMGQPKFGAQKVEVMVGKFEGLRGNIPASFCVGDIMVVTQ